MSTYKIHPIVVGTKIFDKGMMTYQYNYGKQYTIPIYSWYLEGGGKKNPSRYGRNGSNPVEEQ
ncbi:hypothetical protein M1N65_00605 [Thermodesulfovibrionales bacterium]|nr:hypothetical protein [Thermodesulfovibrionales bacterium]